MVPIFMGRNPAHERTHAPMHYTVRNEDNQPISTHATSIEAENAARTYRNDRTMAWSTYTVRENVGDMAAQFANQLDAAALRQIRAHCLHAILYRSEMTTAECDAYCQLTDAIESILKLQR